MGSRTLDHTGRRYGRLVAIRVVRQTPRKENIWLCRCDCGQQKEVISVDLTRGRTTSCGCAFREYARRRATTHGKTNSPEWRSWKSMRDRCYTRGKVSNGYADRGVVVCARWRESFENFLADMGPKPGPGYSIDRIDVNGNYEPGNCRWATYIEQNNNTRANVYFEWEGRRLTVSQWSRELGISISALRARLFKWGWPVGRALTSPPRNYTRRSA